MFRKGSGRDTRGDDFSDIIGHKVQEKERKKEKGEMRGAGAMDSEFIIRTPLSESGCQGLKCSPFPAVVFFLPSLLLSIFCKW